MEPFAWPIAVVLIAVLFMFLFREPIAGLLGRTKRVGKGGLETHEHPQLPASTERDTALAEFMETYDNPLLRDQETLILKELGEKRLDDPDASQRVLVRSLAGTQILLALEKIQNSIFGSQSRLLTTLNSLRDGIPEEQVREVFDAAALEFPTTYEGRDFSQWCNYLTSYGLVSTSDGRFFITQLGREFLKWQIEQGRVPPSYG